MIQVGADNVQTFTGLPRATPSQEANPRQAQIGLKVRF
jgi:hypothetical protein